MINQTQLKKLMDLVMQSDWTVEYKLEVLHELENMQSSWGSKHSFLDAEEI